MEAIYNMDINELNQDFIELLKKMFIGAKLQIIVHTDLASNHLYKLANDSFSEVWDYNSPYIFSSFISNKLVVLVSNKKVSLNL